MWLKQRTKHLQTDNAKLYTSGCDRGIGHELAKKLDSLGYHVFAGCLFKGQTGEQDLLAGCSSRLRTLQMDVKSQEQVQQAAALVQKMLGKNSKLFFDLFILHRLCYKFFQLRQIMLNDCLLGEIHVPVFAQH